MFNIGRMKILWHGNRVNSRAAKSHALGVRLTHLRSISRSHASIWISHAKHRMRGLNKFCKCVISLLKTQPMTVQSVYSYTCPPPVRRSCDPHRLSGNCVLPYNSSVYIIICIRSLNPSHQNFKSHNDVIFR